MNLQPEKYSYYPISRARQSQAIRGLFWYQLWQILRRRFRTLTGPTPLVGFAFSLLICALLGLPRCVGWVGRQHGSIRKCSRHPENCLKLPFSHSRENRFSSPHFSIVTGPSVSFGQQRNAPTIFARYFRLCTFLYHDSCTGNCRLTLFVWLSRGGCWSPHRRNYRFHS